MLRRGLRLDVCCMCMVVIRRCSGSGVRIACHSCQEHAVCETPQLPTRATPLLLGAGCGLRATPRYTHQTPQPKQCINLYMYTYIHTQRERDTHTHTTCFCVPSDCLAHARTSPPPPPPPPPPLSLTHRLSRTLGHFLFLRGKWPHARPLGAAGPPPTLRRGR